MVTLYLWEPSKLESSSDLFAFPSWDLWLHESHNLLKELCFTFENLTGWKEESPAPSQPPPEEQLDYRGTSRISTDLLQDQGLVRYFENPTKMTAVIQRTFREHHNSSKYLHWCTGLACGNLLFPPIWYFAILHGRWLWKQECFHIFHTTKWHPSDKPGMRERKKYLSLHWCHDATMQWQFTFNSWTLSLSESSRHPFQNILTELTRAECIWYGCQLTEFAARRSC